MQSVQFGTIDVIGVMVHGTCKICLTKFKQNSFTVEELNPP